MEELTLEPTQQQSTGAYNQRELDTLENLQNLRMGMINALTKDGVPDNTRELRLLNEIITTTESSIHTGVANRIKYVDGQNMANTQALVAEALRQAAKKQSSANVIDLNPDLVKELTEDEIVPGEMEITPTELITADFMSDSFECDDVDDEDTDDEFEDDDDDDEI